MSHELIFTSAPKGLRPGSQGFCTVVSTDGLSPTLQDRLESLSGYRHVFAPGDAQAVQNPVVFSHYRIPDRGRNFNVVSRVADSGLDYSNRTNKLAHHLVLEPNERAPGGPASLLATPGLMTQQWDGQVMLRRGGPQVPLLDVSPSIASTWQTVTGDAGWGGVLAEAGLADPNRPVFLIFQPGQDLLPLIQESIALIPQAKRWQVTFTTYFTGLPQDVRCAWQGILKGSPEEAPARRFPNALVLDLTSPMGEPKGRLVDAARSGQVPPELQSSGPPPPPPPLVAKSPLVATPAAAPPPDPGPLFTDDIFEDDDPDAGTYDIAGRSGAQRPRAPGRSRPGAPAAPSPDLPPELPPSLQQQISNLPDRKGFQIPGGIHTVLLALLILVCTAAVLYQNFGGDDPGTGQGQAAGGDGQQGGTRKGNANNGNNPPARSTVHDELLELSCEVGAGKEKKLDRPFIGGQIRERLTLESYSGTLTAMRPEVPSGAPWKVTASGSPENAVLLVVNAAAIDPVKPGGATTKGKLRLIRNGSSDLIINYTLNIRFLPSKFFVPVSAEQLKSAGLNRGQLENVQLTLAGGTHGAAQWKTRGPEFGILYTPQGDPQKAQVDGLSFRVGPPGVPGVTISVKKQGDTHVAVLKKDPKDTPKDPVVQKHDKPPATHQQTGPAGLQVGFPTLNGKGEFELRPSRGKRESWALYVPEEIRLLLEENDGQAVIRADTESNPSSFTFSRTGQKVSWSSEGTLDGLQSCALIPTGGGDHLMVLQAPVAPQVSQAAQFVSSGKVASATVGEEVIQRKLEWSVFIRPHPSLGWIPLKDSDKARVLVPDIPNGPTARLLRQLRFVQGQMASSGQLKLTLHPVELTPPEGSVELNLPNGPREVPGSDYRSRITNHIKGLEAARKASEAGGGPFSPEDRKRLERYRKEKQILDAIILSEGSETQGMAWCAVGYQTLRGPVTLQSISNWDGLTQGVDVVRALTGITLDDLQKHHRDWLAKKRTFKTTGDDVPGE